MRVLVVEDDVTIAGNLVDYLRGRGHAVDWAASGGQVLARLDAGSYDVMVLDIGLPGMDGLRLLRLLRTEWRYEFPILMLTALDREEDKLAGFQGGADDYVVKPFSLAEVEARLLALVRRRGVVAEPHVLLALGQAVMFDPARQVLTVNGEVRATTRQVRVVVEKLLRAGGRVVPHAELEEAVWGDIQESSDRLRQLIYQARKVLRDAQGHTFLHTVHGSGYCLREPLA